MEKDNYEVGQNNRAPKVPRHGPGRGMRPGEKAKNFKGTWAKLLTNCKKYWGAMIFAIICAGIGTVLTLIGPDKLSKMTDLITEGVMTGIDMDGIKRIGITLICFYGCSALLSLVQNLIMGYVTQQVSKGLRSYISGKINRLPMWFYNQTSTGDVLSRVTNDVDTIAQSFNQSMGNLVTAVTLLLGSLIMMIKTNIIMTVAAILSTLLGFVFMALIMSKSQKYFARQQMHLGEINGHVEEIYAGHTVVKAYNGEKKSKEKFDKMNENLRDSAFKAQCLSGLMMPLMTFIGNLGYVAVCIVGALLVMNDKISFGVIIAFMMYVRYFTQPLSQIAQAMQALQSAAAAGERVFEFTDAEEMEDERIDKCISMLIDSLSRSFIQKLIKDGGVIVNGKEVKSSYRVKADDEVCFHLPKAVEPDIQPEEIALDILYEDADVIVLNKPKGMVVHPAAGHYSGTLVNALLYHCGDELSGINGVMRPGIVHRIDKDTTGSLIVCKNDKAHKSIAAQLKEHSVTRSYRAICCGVIREEEGCIDAPVGRHPTDRKKMAVNEKNGKRAVTHYKVLERFKEYTYIECRLETGRTHQIRVHMASIGHPLLGDSIYGGEVRKSPFRLEGQTLHAMTIGFIHPSTGKYVEIEAPLPDYFSRLLNILPK